MKKGFTILELIVVIVIIGILSGIGISQFSASVKKANAMALASQLQETDAAMNAYYADTGTYPLNISFLCRSPIVNVENGASVAKENRDSKEINKIWDSISVAAKGGKQDLDALKYWSGPYADKCDFVEGNKNVLKPKYGVSLSVGAKITPDNAVDIPDLLGDGEAVNPSDTFFNVLVVGGLEIDAIRVMFETVNGVELDNFIASQNAGDVASYEGNAREVAEGKTSFKLGIGTSHDEGTNYIVYRFAPLFQKNLRTK